MKSFISRLVSEIRAGASHQKPPTLTGIFGLPGAGKTTIAHQLAELTDTAVLSTDIVRLRFNLNDGQEAQTVIIETAEHILHENISLIIDGLYLGFNNRLDFRALAARHGAHHRLIYVTAAPDVIQRRLQERIDNPEETADTHNFVITPNHFQQIASYLEEPINEADVLTIDTSDGLTKIQLEKILDSS